MNNHKTELQLLSAYLEGMAEALDNQKMKSAAFWLEKASKNICSKGYFGCNGGEKCEFDHK